MKTNRTPALLTLGLCKKAGKLICGTPLVCRALAQKRPPELVVMSGGASSQTKKKLRDKCSYYKVRLYELDAAPEEISEVLGGSGSVASVAICDRGLGGLFLDRAEREINRNEE